MSDENSKRINWGAGFARHNVGRFEPPKVPWPACDWDTWAYKTKASLEGAVLLSLELAPREDLRLQAWQAPPQVPEDKEREYRRRLEIACDRIGPYGPLPALRVMDLANSREVAGALVSLSVFRAWAEGMRWPMPERFPAGEARSPKTESPHAIEQGAVHEIKRRASPVGAILDLATRSAVNPADWQSAWAALVQLAKSPKRPAPLVGYADGEGVKYLADGADGVKFLTRDAFRKWHGRRP